MNVRNHWKEGFNPTSATLKRPVAHSGGLTQRRSVRLHGRLLNLLDLQGCGNREGFQQWMCLLTVLTNFLNRSPKRHNAACATDR